MSQDYFKLILEGSKNNVRLRNKNNKFKI